MSVPRKNSKGYFGLKHFTFTNRSVVECSKQFIKIVLPID